MMKKINYFFIPFFLAFTLLLTGNGCMKLALRMSPELFENMSVSIFEECDPDLARNALSSNLKLLEGLLKNDPENSEILRLLSMGFCGYGILFLENDDKERAINLYYRATNYGLRAVGLNMFPDNITKEDINKLFKNLNKNKLNSLLWLTVSWNSWINLNLDKPVAISQLGLAQLCIDNLAETNPDLFYGLPYILKAVSLSARAPMLGGDYNKSKVYYDKALFSGNRCFFLSQYYYARYYCVGVQDREMFILLLTEIIDGGKEYPEEICLINEVIRDKAEILLQNIDEYFI